MELDEIVGRIFRRHRKLIAGMVVLGLAVALGLHLRDKPLWAGTARLVLNASDPTSAAQSTALADTARAIATGPDLVRGALATVGATRDAIDVAAKHVDVRPLGSSGVLLLTVTDRDPSVAVALANAISTALVKVRQAATSGSVASAVAALQTQIDTIQASIAAIDTQVNALSLSIGSADPAVANAARAERDHLLSQRDGFVQQLDGLQTQHGQLVADSATKPTATVTDPAAAPASPVPGRRLQDLVLGGLLGLLVGIALAAAIESLRPSLVGRAAIAREIQAPVLADLGPSGEWAQSEIAESAMYLEMAAIGASVRHVELISLDRGSDLSELATALGGFARQIQVTHLDPTTARQVTAGATGGDVPAVRVQRQPGAAQGQRAKRGLVVVAPSALRLSDLDPVRDLLSISGWPLLGVIVVEPATSTLARRFRPTQQSTDEEVTA